MSISTAFKSYLRLSRCITPLSRGLNSLSVRYASSKVENTPEHDPNKPIEYLSSKAANLKARMVRTNENEMLWYQPMVVIGSVAAFLIYFCILREENDIDQELNTSLYKRIPGLEKQNLLQLYDYNINNGYDVKEIEKRLKEILIEEKNNAKKAA